MQALNETELKFLMNLPEYTNPYSPHREQLHRVVKQGYKNLHPDDNRNQTSKGYYIWCTEGDDRVRSSHADREGEVFSWDKAPEGGHPGEDWGCRCIAEPYVPADEKNKNRFTNPDSQKISNDPVRQLLNKIYESREKEKPNANESPDLIDYLRYSSTAAVQGLFYGWSDEIEGALGAAGYAIGSKLASNPAESSLEAAKRGYKEFSSYQRGDLKEGYEKAPFITGISEAVGAALSPGGLLFKAAQTAPLKLKDKMNLLELFTTAGVYGIGTTEGGLDNYPEYAKNIGAGLFGNYIGYKSGNGLWGRAGNPLARKILTELTNYSVKKSINLLEQNGKK